MSSKESTCNAGARGDTGSKPGSRRPPGEGLGNPLQYSCLGNPMDRGEAGYIESIGSQTVRYDRSNLACMQRVCNAYKDRLMSNISENA